MYTYCYILPTFYYLSQPVDLKTSVRQVFKDTNVVNRAKIFAFCSGSLKHYHGDRWVQSQTLYPVTYFCIVCS